MGSATIWLGGIFRPKMRSFLACLAPVAVAERVDDLVTSLPGFPSSDTWGFKAYSGILDVPGWGGEYHALKIHYQFHTSRREPSKDPLTVWHQGGPGGSSITVGLFNELGALIVGRSGNYVNEHAWNQVSNMLYLESPAGSGGAFGFSSCLAANSSFGPPAVVDCSWDDRSQAEAYAHTLTAFFEAFPEFGKSDLYLAGESYFGQYGPNIANFMLNTEPFKNTLQLKGLALGNSCWGGNETYADCNGPNPDKNIVDLYHGRDLFSSKVYRAIEKTCEFPLTENISDECYAALFTMSREVGYHNPYNIYDNCKETAKFLQKTGKDMRWLRRTLHEGMHDPVKTRKALLDMNGGYPFDCMRDANHWIVREDVQKALHLDSVTPGASKFFYANHGPASQTLYPELAKRIRILIYSGDADACVPITGTKDQIDDLEDQGAIEEKEPWSPWFNGKPEDEFSWAPAGYLTKFSVPGSNQDFSFATIRMAGHMAPQFQPESSLSLIASFLAGDWSTIQPSSSIVV